MIEHDFHQPNDGKAPCEGEMRIGWRFEDLTLADKAAFAEYLTYEDQGGKRDRCSDPQKLEGNRNTSEWQEATFLPLWKTPIRENERMGQHI